MYVTYLTSILHGSRQINIPDTPLHLRNFLHIECTYAVRSLYHAVYTMTAFNVQVTKHRDKFL